MSFFICVSCLKPDVQETEKRRRRKQQKQISRRRYKQQKQRILKPEVQKREMFNKFREIFKGFILWNMSDAPVEKIVSRNIADATSFVVIYGVDSHPLLAPSQTKPFIECLRVAIEYSKEVSLILFWARGFVDTEKVKCESQCKITIDSFTDIFPDIKENVLYIIHKDYSKLYQ